MPRLQRVIVRLQLAQPKVRGNGLYREVPVDVEQVYWSSLLKYVFTSISVRRFELPTVQCWKVQCRNSPSVVAVPPTMIRDGTDSAGVPHDRCATFPILNGLRFQAGAYIGREGLQRA